MNIEIGKGLSNIIFGMTEDEIIQLLDQPDRILTCRDDGREYLYNALKLKLFFGFEESDRLYSIEVFRKDITFLSTRVIGLSLEDLLSFMQQNGYQEYKVYHFDYFDTIFFDACNTSFTIEFNEVTSFEFSPLFYKDKIIWPCKNQ